MEENYNLNEQLSNFVPFSEARVTQPKEMGSDVIYATPYELFPFMAGELAINTAMTSVTGQTPDGVAFVIEGQSNAGVTATWLPSGDNRITSPDVRRGERVKLFRHADSGKFYWQTMALDEHLRRLEHIVYGASSEPDITKDIEKKSAENCYIVEFSPFNKRVYIHTTKLNGEAYEYTLMLDTDNNQFYVTDDVGTHILLDSANDVVEMANRFETMVRISKKDIELDAKGNYTATVEEKYNVTCRNYTLNVSGASTINSGSVTISSDENTINGPTSFSSECTFGAPVSFNSVVTFGPGFSAFNGAIVMDEEGIRSTLPIQGPRETI